MQKRKRTQLLSLTLLHLIDGQFDKEDDYGNELPESKEPKKPKANDPDRFVDDIGDA